MKAKEIDALFSRAPWWRSRRKRREGEEPEPDYEVTKHVTRVKLTITGLMWNEDYLDIDESVGSSPSDAKFKQPAKSVLKMNKNNLILFI